VEIFFGHPTVERCQGKSLACHLTQQEIRSTAEYNASTALMQVKWLFDHCRANDYGHVFIISVDGVHCPINEPGKNQVQNGIRTSLISRALLTRLQSQCIQARSYG
jgi:hypothetical protein